MVRIEYYVDGKGRAKRHAFDPQLQTHHGKYGLVGEPRVLGRLAALETGEYKFTPQNGAPFAVIGPCEAAKAVGVELDRQKAVEAQGPVEAEGVDGGVGECARG